MSDQNEIWTPDSADLGDVASMDYGDLVDSLRKDLQLDASTDLAFGSLTTARQTQIVIPLAQGGAVAGAGQATFPNAAGTLVNFNSSAFLRGGFTFNGTNGFVVPRAGIYRMQGQITLSNGNAFAGNGYFQATPTINTNGFAPSNGMGMAVTNTSSLNFPTATSAPAFVPANVGDVLGMALINQTGITVTLNEASLLIEFVSPNV